MFPRSLVHFGWSCFSLSIWNVLFLLLTARKRHFLNDTYTLRMRIRKKNRTHAQGKKTHGKKERVQKRMITDKQFKTFPRRVYENIYLLPVNTQSYSPARVFFSILSHCVSLSLPAVRLFFPFSSVLESNRINENCCAMSNAKVGSRVQETHFCHIPRVVNYCHMKMLISSYSVWNFVCLDFLPTFSLFHCWKLQAFGSNICAKSGEIFIWICSFISFFKMQFDLRYKHSDDKMTQALICWRYMHLFVYVCMLLCNSF